MNVFSTRSRQLRELNGSSSRLDVNELVNIWKLLSLELLNSREALENYSTKNKKDRLKPKFHSKKLCKVTCTLRGEAESSDSAPVRAE